MLKALIVEDDKLLANTLKNTISEKFVSDVCSDGLEAIELLKTNEYNLVIADIVLPKVNGLGLLKKLKELDKILPVVIVAFSDSYTDKSEVMEYPMAEYFLRSKTQEEFLIMLDNLLQRFKNKKNNSELTYKNITIDIDNQLAYFDGVLLENIKGKYLDLLYFFVLNNNIILKKEEIFDRVWGVNSETTMSAIEVYISGLRKELKKVGASKYLKTIRGVGYSLS